MRCRGGYYPPDCKLKVKVIQKGEKYNCNFECRGGSPPDTDITIRDKFRFVLVQIGGSSKPLPYDDVYILRLLVHQISFRFMC